ncbi:unnamed protein product [Thelazia callipaeda]|uniref:CX9C domain-containing protein n=1 Tax=Thelazia callipaeda TaxID=103827 RepID=A0A0N5D141_THECL|nr:unnamed protein product [Thelazia callipaeda]
MSEKFDPIPDTFDEQMQKLKQKYNEYKAREEITPKWFDRENNEQQYKAEIEKFFFSSSNYIRYPQMKCTKHCSDYFADYHRCIEILGKQYEPCNFFKIVFTNLCPSTWTME